jgi:Ca2+-binding RTX toxin-like protein
VSGTGAHDVTLSGLTIARGRLEGDGAGIYNDSEKLTLNEVVVTGNEAYGAQGLGGGLFSVGGEVIVNDSTFHGNSATRGGALRTQSGTTLTINRSTFYDNEASALEGALSAHQTTAYIENSTFSGNSAPSGGAIRTNSTGAMTIVNSTITQNTATGYGGGIQVAGTGTVTLHNTILAANTAGDSASQDVSGALGAASSYNLIGQVGGSGLINNVNGNQVGTATVLIDPLLAPLADNNGPTKTHAPLVGSPVVDKGSDHFAPATDQRGHRRPMDLAGVGNEGTNIADIGAFEAGNPTVLTVTVLDDELDPGVVGNGPGLSLREALAYAATTAAVEEIEFDPALFTTKRIIELVPAYGALPITTGVRVHGPGADWLTIDANGASSAVALVHNPVGYEAEISGLSLTGASYSAVLKDAGGQAILTLDRVEVFGNAGHGVVFSYGGTLIVSNSTIANNAATGISAEYSEMIVSNSTISTNKQGIYTFGVTVSLRNSTITANHLPAPTGTANVAGVDIYDGSVELHNTIIAGNTAGSGNQIVASDFFAESEWVNPIVLPSTYNLIGYDASGLISTASASHNLVGASAQNPLNAGLSSLGNYGGPTRTHALLPNSPAIDKGKDSLTVSSTTDSLPLDQRGFKRIDDNNNDDATNNVDIGAFELLRPVVVRKAGTVLEIDDRTANVDFVAVETAIINQVTRILVNGVALDVTTYPATSITGVTVLGGAGDDVIDFSRIVPSHLPSVTGTNLIAEGEADNDSLIGSVLNDSLRGGDGDDLLEGRGGVSDTMIGGAGSDTYRFAGTLTLGTDLVVESNLPGSGSDTLDFSELNYEKGIDVNLGNRQQVISHNGKQLTVSLNSASLFENVIGTSYADILYGNLANNRLEGGLGDDLYMFSNSNGGGLDKIIGDDGSIDTMNFSGVQGGPGVTVDLNSTSPAELVRQGFSWWFDMSEPTYIRNIVGSSSSDTLTGNDYGNTIEGGGGSDTLSGGAGSGGFGSTDILNGGSGDDRYIVNNRVNSPYVSKSVTLIDASGIDTIDLSSWTGSAGATLNLGTASQSLDGAANLVRISFAVQDIIENAVGTNYNDALTGNSFKNRLEGGAGNDTLTGLAGDDTYGYSGTENFGTDTIVESNGQGTDKLDFSLVNFATGSDGVNVSLSSTSGMHQVVNRDGVQLTLNMSNAPVLEQITGSSYNDVLAGNALDNRLEGGLGNDRYVFNGTAGLGTDTLVESASSAFELDTLDFSGLNFGGTGVKLNLATSGLNQQVANNAGQQLTINLSSLYFEGFVGTANADTITDNNRNNTLDGGLGDDTYKFVNYGGTDKLIEATDGGTDKLDFSGLISPVNVDLGSTSSFRSVGSSFGSWGLDMSAAPQIENILGGSGNDTLTGNALNNVIEGSGGNDSIHGALGTDTLRGGIGHDGYTLVSFGEEYSPDIVDDSDNDFFSVDGAPVIEINVPIDGSSHTTSQVVVSGRVSGAALDELRIDSALVTAGVNGTFSSTLTLADGTHEITIRAVSTNGKTALRTITVTVDAAPPELEILSPVEGTTVTAQNVFVSVRTDALTAAITIDGQVAAKDGFVFTRWVTLQPGNSIVNIVANALGQQSTKQLHVTFAPPPGYNPNGDDDTDGVVNQEDLFPNAPGESGDSDNDGTGNNVDPDDNDPTEKGTIRITSLQDGQVHRATWKNLDDKRQLTLAGVIDDDSPYVTIKIKSPDARAGAERIYYANVDVDDGSFSSPIELLLGRNEIEVIGETVSRTLTQIVEVKEVDMRIQLSWGGGFNQDYDLYVEDINYSNKSNGAGQLDRDARHPPTDFPAIENVTYLDAAAGLYRIYVNYFSDHDTTSPQTTTIRVFIDEQQVYIASKLLTQDEAKNTSLAGDGKSVWNVGTLVVHADRQIGAYRVENRDDDVASVGLLDLYPTAIVEEDSQLGVSQRTNFRIDDLNGPNGDDDAYMFVGQAMQFTATGIVNLGSSNQETRALLEKFVVSDPTIATIDELGVLVALKSGVVTVTAGNQPPVEVTILNAEVDVPGDIDAASQQGFASIVFSPFFQSDLTPIINGKNVAFRVFENGEQTATSNISITDGAAAIDFDTSTTPRDTYFIEAEIAGYILRSPGLRVIAAEPASITTTQSQQSFVADGQGIITLEATIRDEFGNLVEDDTPVSWMVDSGTSVFSGGAQASTVLTVNGKASVQLRAPAGPGIQRIVVTAGEAEKAVEISATAPTLQIAGATALNLAANQTGFVTINTNAANGTPVYWTISNGDTQAVVGTVVNGSATLPVTAGGAWGRVGSAIVTATVGGRLVYHEMEFYSTAPFYVEVERNVLSGDKSSNGFETLNFGNLSPLYQGQPIWGFTPPPQQWPAARNVAYFAQTSVTIHGTPLGDYYVLAGSPSNSFIEFLGLGPNGKVTLDANGEGTFIVRSKGLLAAGPPSDFLPVEFIVQEGAFVGAPQTQQKLMLVEHTWWTRTWDATKSFFGGDPQTVAGVGANVAGGMLIVGDAGSLIKNGWRATPMSDVEPNYVEASLSGLGLATEVAVGVGEVADAPISTARAFIAAARGTKFADVLSILVKRAISNAEDMAKIGKFLFRIGRSQAGFELAKQVFTSEDLMAAGIRAVDELGEGSGPFIERMAHYASGLGSVATAQNITALMGKLSGDGLNYVKGLNPAQMDQFVERLTLIFKTDQVDPALMQKLLEYDELYALSPTYGRAELIYDLARISEATDGYTSLIKSVANFSPKGRAGRLLELQAAAKLLDSGEITHLTAFAKLVRGGDNAAGRVITDLDLVGESAGAVAYYQVKNSADAFRSLEKTKAWVIKARKYASQNGVTDPVLKYVVPKLSDVPANIKSWLDDEEIEIIALDLL